MYSGTAYDSGPLVRSLTNAGGFANPFMDMASLAMPRDNRTALQFAEYIWDSQETYREAQLRKISYFLTDVEIDANTTTKQLSNDEKKKWQSFLNDTLGILDVIRAMDTDREAYGNAFATLYVPFKRFLVCPRCKTQYPLSVVYYNQEFKFEWELPKFVATCQNCKVGSGYRGPFSVNDMPADLEKNLKVRTWSPHQIEILEDLYSGDTAYLWRIPEDYKKQLRTGNLYHLERASLQVLKAVQHNLLYRFHPNVMFHMRERVLSGRKARGWGLSRILVNFRQIWYVQVLRRYNEALALDYIIPFRLLTPEVRTGAGGGASSVGDPLKMMNMANFGGSFLELIHKRRRDPCGWHFLPFPVKYQTLGGDAANLAPKDLLDQGYEVMLNGSGTPMELYRGSLQLQTAPVALRLFEATNMHLVHDNNTFLAWLVDQISQVLSWEQVTAKMRRVLYADDFNKQMAQLQLMMGQAISQTTGLRSMGLDWDSEQRQIAEEARRQAQLQAEVQEEMEQSAFGEQIAKGQSGSASMGGAAAGGAAAGGGQAPPQDPAAAAAGQVLQPVTSLIQSGNVPQSLDDMIATAESLAVQLLGMAESQKDSQLRELKKKNEALHSLVRAKMDEHRNRARTAGGAMLLGQQGGA